MGNPEKGPQAKRLFLAALVSLISAQWHPDLCAKERPQDPCHRLSAESAVPEPEDLRSRNGELTVDLTIHNYTEPDGSIRYCYTSADGTVSPNLRLNPGDLLILNLKTQPGTISHDYSDHVSILKFIERNWNVGPVSKRSRDNFPNPVVSPANPYVPDNTPAIGDLFDLFSFSPSRS